jgi:uncharacterized protein (TIGR02265 family)
MGLDLRIKELIQHCDLEERLVSVPPSAKVRGLFMKNTTSVLDDAGKLPAYEEIYPESYSAIRWYPTSDYLQRLAVGGALLTSPEAIHAGMEEIGKRSALSFGDSLLGKAMLRLLSRDPVKLLKQGCAGRRQSHTYGRWEVSFPEPNMAVMAMFEEYAYIESNLLGAAEGTLESLGLEVSVEVELDSKFQGRHILRWK